MKKATLRASLEHDQELRAAREEGYKKGYDMGYKAALWCARRAGVDFDTELSRGRKARSAEFREGYAYAVATIRRNPIFKDLVRRKIAEAVDGVRDKSYRAGWDDSREACKKDVRNVVYTAISNMDREVGL